ncbi:MAG: autotransporter-associated beta strand repeat-containing protein [Thermoguttaceae bacterium]|nr:autotransporter-associated beta strand repeat-containing protein [Thermoguttaceae bacterium]
MADTKVWVGDTDANLATAANWSGGVAPVDNDAWQFGAVGSAGYNLTNDIANGLYSTGITFTDSATGSYTISGNWVSQSGDIVNNSSYLQTLVLGHALYENITINAANGDIKIGNNNTIHLNNHTLTIDGSHDTTLEILVNHNGSLIKNGTGTLTMKRPVGTDVHFTDAPFTGNVTINDGTIKAIGTSSLGAYNSVSRTITINNGAKLTFASHDVLGIDSVRTPVKIIVDGGTIENEYAADGWFNTINTLTLKNGGKIVDNNGHHKWTSFQLVGTVNVTADSKLDADKISTIGIGTAGDYNGVIPNGAVFNVADVTQDDSPDFIISDILTNGNGTTIAGSFTKTGAGTMELSAANTYTGATTVSDGVLRLTGNAVTANSIITLEANETLGTKGTLEYNIASSEKTLEFSNTASVIGNGDILKTGEGRLLINTDNITSSDLNFSADNFVVASGRVDIRGYMNGNLSVEGPEAIFSPGNSVGDAVFGGGYILKEGATLLIEQDETGIDTLTASSFTIDSKSIIDIVADSLQPGEYPIIFNTSSEGFQGDLATDNFWNGLLTPGSDYYWNLSVVNGNTVYATIDANAVPEPSTWALLILGAAGLLYVRKRTRK